MISLLWILEWIAAALLCALATGIFIFFSWVLLKNSRNRSQWVLAEMLNQRFIDLVPSDRGDEVFRGKYRQAVERKLFYQAQLVVNMGERVPSERIPAFWYMRKWRREYEQFIEYVDVANKYGFGPYSRNPNNHTN